MDNITEVVVGVDVSKAHLDVYIDPIETSKRIANNEIEIAKLIKGFSKYVIKQIAFESTGGYECLFKKMLAKTSYKAWCIDPKRIKSFIRSQGIKAKTDRIDAKMIAQFARKNESNYQPLILSEEALRLKSYMRRRVDLSELISLEKKRMNHPKEDCNKEIIAAHIAYMQEQIKQLEEQVFQLIKCNQNWQEQYSIITSAPGMGPITAATLIAFVPEIGLIDSKKIAALVGVAPYTKQSGIYQGKEKIQEGRSIPRKALYMAALSAIQTNSWFAEFYLRLIKNGKAPKVALIATMHKMLITINAMVKNQKFWDPNSFCLTP